MIGNLSKLKKVGNMNSTDELVAIIDKKNNIKTKTTKANKMTKDQKKGAIKQHKNEIKKLKQAIKKHRLLIRQVKLTYRISKG